MLPSDEKIMDYGFGDVASAGFYIAFRLEFLLPEFECKTLPRAWIHKYTRHGLMMFDPVMQWIYSNTGAVRWSEIDLPDPHGILMQASEYGLSYGVAISLRDPEDPSIRSFGNFCRSDRELSDTEISDLTQKLELLFSDLTAPDDVTEAELEVLAGIKSGRLIKEIAYELNVTEGAIKQRLRSAKDKLGARTTPQAVAIADSYGLI
ncbi:helix-turn-helix transcriptional regulator [Flavimaricola marinus]|uniref:DNA-binding transcriptional activator SdiA n=1 Tax=Flavimaricola marinus TaxID=1819565 RepID=A0A238LCX4_9RHOB|nr:LuxR family transcriptional regulator [Flavimaricola marinus]SMY07264.1 DNA-binding transcriptional activator SdiA [Flavimaricola marinus]